MTTIPTTCLLPLALSAPAALHPGLAQEADAAPVQATLPEVSVEVEPGVRSLVAAGAPLLAWHHGYDPERHEETYKPVLHLRSPDGAVQLTKDAGGLYSHHRGLFLGWRDVRSGDRVANTWFSPEGRRDRQVLEEFLDVPGGLGARVTWIAGDGEPIAWDERRFRLVEHSASHYVFDAELVVHALGQPLALDGDPAHGGFQVRFAQEVAERDDCSYLQAAGSEPLGGDDWGGCSWMAGRAQVAGRTFAIGLIDHPRNPRPTVYNARSYGRFGPFARAEVRPDEPLTLRYRVVVFDVDALGRNPSRADYWSRAVPFRGEAEGVRTSGGGGDAGGTGG